MYKSYQNNERLSHKRKSRNDDTTTFITVVLLVLVIGVLIYTFVNFNCDTSEGLAKTNPRLHHTDKKLKSKKLLADSTSTGNSLLPSDTTDTPSTEHTSTVDTISNYLSNKKTQITSFFGENKALSAANLKSCVQSYLDDGAIPSLGIRGTMDESKFAFWDKTCPAYSDDVNKKLKGTIDPLMKNLYNSDMDFSDNLTALLATTDATTKNAQVLVTIDSLKTLVDSQSDVLVNVDTTSMLSQLSDIILQTTAYATRVKALKAYVQVFDFTLSIQKIMISEFQNILVLNKYIFSQIQDGNASTTQPTATALDLCSTPVDTMKLLATYLDNTIPIMKSTYRFILQNPLSNLSVQNGLDLQHYVHRIQASTPGDEYSYYGAAINKNADLLNLTKGLISALATDPAGSPAVDLAKAAVIAGVKGVKDANKKTIPMIGFYEPYNHLGNKKTYPNGVDMAFDNTGHHMAGKNMASKDMALKESMMGIQKTSPEYHSINRQ